MGLRPLLAAHRALATVDLTDSGIGDEGAALVARALLANASVTALGLSGNRVRAPPERRRPIPPALGRAVGGKVGEGGGGRLGAGPPARAPPLQRAEGGGVLARLVRGEGHDASD